MVDPEDVELVNDSLARCTPQAKFFEHFYTRFSNSSDEVAGKFAGTDPKAQARALRTAFLLVLQAVAGDPGAWQELEMRAARHDRRHLDIRPELYDQWRECLIETVREFDSAADSDVERAWRNVVQEAIEFMVARY